MPRLTIAETPLWTIARVAGFEHPRLPVLRIDLEKVPADSRQLDALAAELLHNDGEAEVALRNRAAWCRA